MPTVARKEHSSSGAGVIGSSVGTRLKFLKSRMYFELLDHFSNPYSAYTQNHEGIYKHTGGHNKKWLQREQNVPMNLLNNHYISFLGLA